MSAVTGAILSSKDVSLSRAARTLRQFVESDTGAKPDTAAYLRRAAAAFDEILEFHDKIRRGEDEEEDAGNGDVEEKKRKKEKKKEKTKRKREMEYGDERSDGDLSKGRNEGLEEAENLDHSEVNSDRKKKKKKRKKSDKERGNEEN